jgi:SAM-dependent methyltransferase
MRLDRLSPGKTQKPKGTFSRAALSCDAHNPSQEPIRVNPFSWEKSQKDQKRRKSSENPGTEKDFSSPRAAVAGLFAQMERNEGKRRGKPFSQKGSKKGPIPGKKFMGKPNAGGSAKSGTDKGWDGVAGWYDKLVGADGSDYHQNVILPGVMLLLDIQKGDSVVDICCGQGVLVKHLITAGAGKIHGIDASDKLISSASQRHGNDPRVSFEVADVCGKAPWANAGFDKAACVMAVHDVPDAAALMKNVSAALKPGGSFAIVMMHPCFRIPKESHWGWDGDQKIQFRRLDKYGSALEIGIQTRPGLNTGEGTVFYHRPLADLLTAIGAAGMGVTQCTELFSHRRSQSGPFSKAEHKAAEEFPLFLGIKAVKM